MEALLEEREVSAEKIIPLIREATLSQEVTPVMMGTAYKNKGVQELLDAIVAYLPSPLDRQVDATDLSKKANDEAKAAAPEGTKPEPVKVRLEAIPDAPLVCMAFKTVEEQFGQLTFVRLYQGKLSKGDTITNTRTSRKVRIGRLLRMHADQREDLDSAEAGDIVAAVGLDCASGDTFCGPGADYALESIFVPEPVIKLSIEPLKREGSDKEMAEAAPNSFPPRRPHVPRHQRRRNRPDADRRHGAIASGNLRRTHPPRVQGRMHGG